MSKWSTLTGTITFHKSKHLSLKKLCALIFDDHNVVMDGLSDKDCYHFRVGINFREEGDRAYNEDKKLVKVLEEDYNAKVDLILTVHL